MNKTTKRFNTMFDIGFTIEHNYEDPYDIPKELLIKALQDRIDYIRTSKEEGIVGEVFGVCDTYEVI